MQQIYNLFPDFPDSSRVWIYTANRAITLIESDFVQSNLELFSSEWKAHSQPLKAKACMLNEFTVVFVVDQSITSASGCSAPQWFCKRGQRACNHTHARVHTDTSTAHAHAHAQAPCESSCDAFASSKPRGSKKKKNAKKRRLGVPSHSHPPGACNPSGPWTCKGPSCMPWGSTCTYPVSGPSKARV